MYEQVEKPKENKSRAVANSVTQKKSAVRQGFGFVDNRKKLEGNHVINGEPIQKVAKYGKMGDLKIATSYVTLAIGPATAGPGLWAGGKPGWIDYEKLLDELFKHQQPGVIEFQGKKINACLCGICGDPATELGISIDHKLGWQSYIDQYQGAAPGTLTSAEAQILYNDPANLRVVHSRCNSRGLERKSMVTKSQMVHPGKTEVDEDDEV